MWEKVKEYWKAGVQWLGRITDNPRKAQLAILVFVLLLLGTFATQCRAEPVLQFEGGSTIVRGYTPAVGLTLIWPEAGPLDADFQCGIQLVGTSTFRDEHQSNQAAVQCLIVDGYKKLDLGIGVVALQNTDDYNGSHANFSLMAGYRLTDKFGVLYRHWSNAGSVDPNLGRDMVLLTYRF